MANITHTIKIDLKPNISFSQREKTINEEIQRNIDILNSRGLITVSHSVLNKNESFATVNFNLTKMFGA
jgi:hypothetical protein